MKLVKKSVLLIIFLSFFLFFLASCQKDNSKPKGKFEIIKSEPYSNACIFELKYIPENRYVIKDDDIFRISYINKNKDTENNILEKKGKNLYRVLCNNTLNEFATEEKKEDGKKENTSEEKREEEKGTKFTIKATFKVNGETVSDYEVYTFSFKVEGVKPYNSPIIDINSVEQYLKLAQLNFENPTQIDYNNYKLTADLDFKDKEFRMLSLYLGGSFNGNGFVIKNIAQVNFKPSLYTKDETIKNTTCSLFDEIKGSGVVTNLELDNVQLSNNLGFGNDRLVGYGLVSNIIKSEARVENIRIKNVTARLYTNGLPFLLKENEIASYGILAGTSSAFVSDILISNCDITYVNLSQPRSGFALAIGNQQESIVERITILSSRLTIVNKEKHNIINEEVNKTTNTYATDPLITNYLKARPETYKSSGVKPEDDKATIADIKYENAIGLVCGLAKDAKVSNTILIGNKITTSLEDEFFTDNKDDNKVYINLNGLGVGFTVKVKGDETTGQNLDNVVGENFRFVEKGTEVTVYFQEKFFAKDFNVFSGGFAEDEQRLYKVLINGYTRDVVDFTKDKKNILKYTFIANENTTIQTLYYSFFLGKVGSSVRNAASTDKIEHITPASAYYHDLYKGRILNYNNNNIYPIKPRYVICEQSYHYSYNDHSDGHSGLDSRQNYFYKLCMVDDNGYFSTVYEGDITNFYIFSPIVKTNSIGFISGDYQAICKGAFIYNNTYEHLPKDYLVDKTNNVIYSTDEFSIKTTVTSFAGTINNVVATNNKLAVPNDTLEKIYYNKSEAPKLREIGSNTNEFKGIYLLFTSLGTLDLTNDESLRDFIKGHLMDSENDTLLNYFYNGIKNNYL